MEHLTDGTSEVHNNGANVETALFMAFPTTQEKLRLRKHSAWRNTGISIGILATCSLIGFLFYSFHLSEANIISIYIISIFLISSITSHWIYGVISSVAGVLLFNFLYADPTFNFYVYDMQYSITTIVMLITSLITNYVMTLFRKHLDWEMMEIRRLDILLETSQHLQQAQSMDDILTISLTQLHKMLDHSILIFPVSNQKLLQPMLKTSENDADISLADFKYDTDALEQFITAENTGKSASLNASCGKSVICFKLMSGKTIFAVACIFVNSSNDLKGFKHNLLLAMLDEITLSLEKHTLHLFNERIAREAEAERLRTNLLRSISHDLRTPLTSISGNADILLHNGDKIGPDLRKQLYKNIYNDSEWLINLVENLLFITRIENGIMSINTEYEVLQEIIHESLRCIANRTTEHKISLEIPDELFVVKIDARLIMQVVINIMENAITYTPAGSDIKIRIFRRDSQAIVEVADTGCGISDGDKLKVLELFYTTNKKSSDSRRGIGLGLPLCQSIVCAHGGTIHIADNDPIGTVVSFSLQLEEASNESKYTGG